MLLLLLFACAKDDTAPSVTTETAAPTEETEETEETETSETEPPAPPDPLTEEQAAQIDAAASAVLGTGASAVSVAVWHDGGIVYASAVGTRDPASPTRVDAGVDSLFQVGSQTKLLTAVAVLQQVEAGTLSLDAPFSAIAPDLDLAQSPGWADSVTLHDLLTHQGATFDYTPWDGPSDDASLEAEARTFADRSWALGAPGLFMNYSNANYGLLGVALERATGASYAEAMRAGVFEPLGLTHTAATRAEAATLGDLTTAYGYIPVSVDWFDPYGANEYDYTVVPIDTITDSAFVRPAGGVWSTASEMAMVGAFLMRGDPNVLSDASVAAMKQAHVPMDTCGDGQAYGYGLFSAPGLYGPASYRVGPVVFHGGNTLTHTASMVILPEQDLVIEVLASGYYMDLTGVIEAAIEAVGAGPPAGDAPEFGPEGAHDAYVGTYVDGLIGEFTITDTDGTLRIEQSYFTGPAWQPVPELIPFCPDLYFFEVDRGYYVPINFYGASPGFAVNRTFTGTRVE
jgi:CubicO group peptidase (beta-lactamase class C family)